MGRHEDLNRDLSPIGNDGAPFVNELQEQGPPPREKADLERLAKNITLSTSDAEKDRLIVQIFGAAQEQIIESQYILLEVLNDETVAKYPRELDGKGNEEVGVFLENLKKTKPEEFKALMEKVSEKTISSYESAGINTKTLSVLWGEALTSAGTGLKKSVEDMANMSPQGMLATSLVGGGTYLLTGKKRWALGLGGLTAVFQSREATNFLNKQALPAVGRTVVGTGKVLGKLATAPGHVINAIINGKPEKVIDIANAFTQGDVNNVLRYVAGGELPPEGSPKILIQAVREYMAKDIAVAPIELQPILKVVLTGSPAEKAALSRDQIIPAVDFLIQTSHLNISQQELVEILQKRVKSKELTIEERQKFSLIQSRNIVDKYLQGNPNFSYEELIKERFAHLEAENGGKISQLTLEEAIPTSDKLKNHDFSMSMPQINKFMQSKGLPMPKYGTEWLLWVYVLTSVITPAVLKITKKIYKGDKKEEKKKVAEPEIEDEKVKKIEVAIKDGETSAFLKSLFKAGIIQKEHQAGIKKRMDEEQKNKFSSNDFKGLSESIKTDHKQASIRNIFYKNFDAKYGGEAIAESQKFENNLQQLGNAKNWWTNNKKKDKASAGISFTGDNIPLGLSKVRIQDFSRMRNLLGVGNPLAYARKLNNLSSGVTYLPIKDQGEKTKLLKIVQEKGELLISESVKSWHPGRKVTSVLSQTFTRPAKLNSILFDGEET